MANAKTETAVRIYHCTRLSKDSIGQAEAYFWASVGYECRVYDSYFEDGRVSASAKYFLSCKPLVQLSLGNKLNGDRIN